jgi:hypothetical protein
MSESKKTENMSQEEEKEWEIEILAYIKGKENADNAATEILATLLNSPYTYFDMKITPYTPNAKPTEKLRIKAERKNSILNKIPSIE